jgi:hypothetical protein
MDHVIVLIPVQYLRHTFIFAAANMTFEAAASQPLSPWSLTLLYRIMPALSHVASSNAFNFAKPLHLPRRNLHVHPSLLPKQKHLLIRPVSAVVGKFDVEVPEESRQDESHLHVREAEVMSEKYVKQEQGSMMRLVFLLLAYAISRSKTKRVKSFFIVGCESGVTEPAFGNI